MGWQTKAGQLNTLLDEERKQAREKLALLDDAQRKLSESFKALSAEALKSNNQSFLDLAKTSLEKFQEVAKGDLDKRQQAIVDMVKPVKESLEKVDSKIKEFEKAREGAYQGLTEQVKSLFDTQKDLRSETSNLVKALRLPSFAAVGARFNCAASSRSPAWSTTVISSSNSRPKATQAGCVRIWSCGCRAASRSSSIRRLRWRPI